MTCAAIFAKAGIVPIGMDLSFGMLSHAKTDAPLVQCDALRLPIADGAVDGVTCGFALRNFADLNQFFAELGRVTRPGGRVALLDASTPPNPVMKFGHGIYFGQRRSADRRAPQRPDRIPVPTQVARVSPRATGNA